MPRGKAFMDDVSDSVNQGVSQAQAAAKSVKAEVDKATGKSSLSWNPKEWGKEEKTYAAVAAAVAVVAVAAIVLLKK